MKLGHETPSFITCRRGTMDKMTSIQIKQLFKKNGILLQDGEAKLLRLAATCFYKHNLHKGCLLPRDEANFRNYNWRVGNMAGRHLNFPTWKSEPCLLVDFAGDERSIL